MTDITIFCYYSKILSHLLIFSKNYRIIIRNGVFNMFEIQLEFTQKLLKNMNVSSCIVDAFPDVIPSEIDLGLRKSLFGTENYAKLFEKSMSSAKEKTVYRFYDEYYCSYIFLRLPDKKKEKFLYIGPYLLEAVNEERLRNADVNPSVCEDLLKYYNRLPVVEDENLLFTVVNTLCESFWSSTDCFSFEYIDYIIHDRSSPFEISPSYEDFRDSPFSLEMLESNYENERMLMEAVSQGKLHKVNAITSSVYNNGTEERISDSLRNRKNYLIILNTLLRKAAEYGDVHPLHINKMSSHFAIKIENVHSIEQSLHLQSEMIRSYCILVKQHSLKNYSYLVGKVITVISYDLTADLSLNTLSKQLNVNPPYLSALFKKECGITLTDYVNGKRIEYAKALLASTDKLINNVAFECGVADTNYFIKLFKKETGLTPTEFRKNIKKL